MPGRREHRSLRLAACVTCLTLFAGVVRAQEEAPAEIVDAQQQPQADDANVGVFVRDSAVAADKLALAQRMERAQEWDTSAEVYQEVLDGFADRVVATHVDAQGRPDRYGSVTSVVQDRIAAWPEAGREVYLARYGAPATKLLEAAAPDDRAALSRVADRYFVTDAGRDAALALIELHFNAGEFAAAASLADRLLDRHPALSETDRPLLLLRSALAWRLANEPSRAKPRVDELNAKHADARAILGGQEQSLSAVAAAEFARPRDARATLAAQTQAGGWRVPFGSNDHAAIAAEADAPPRGQPPREWGKLLSFEFAGAAPAASIENDPELSSLRALVKRQRDLGASTGILPSIDGTELFFQDNSRIYARDLATGAPLPGWLAARPADAGAYKIDAATAPRGAQMTVTLTDAYVVAILGQGDRMAAMLGGERPGGPMNVASVVCLDRATGKPVWTRRMTDAANAKAAMDAKTRRPGNDAKQADAPVAPPPQNRAQRRRAGGVPNAVPGATLAGDESLRLAEPSGSALVVGDAVYVVARGGEAGAFEDCYLVSFTLSNGEFRWARHLASGNAARMNMNGMPMANETAESHLAAIDGRIFVSTDMGAIAAVDATDGSLAWLSLYPRPRAPLQQQQWMNNNGMNPARVRPAFEGNPIIVRDGKVLAMPADAEHLFVYDITTGAEVARVPTKWRLTDGGRFADAPAAGDARLNDDRIDEANVLAGLAGDRVVIASPQAISTLDWTKIREANGTELLPRDVVVRREEVRKPGFEDVAIRGRPFVTDRSIYVPTAWALFRLDLETGVALERYPANDDWQNRPDESPGNVLVVNGNVIVAGPDRVSVYAGLGLVRQRLEAAIASAPDAVAPRLRYAEAMANAGHNDEALRFIAEAASKIGAGRAAGDADRAALFTTCVMLVRDLSRPGRTPDPAFQAKLLAQLGEIAATPTQQVTARLLRGGLAAKARDFPTAVEAYQSLIDEPAWATMRAKNGADVTLIGSLASDALKVLVIDAVGRKAYAPIEARAADALEKAKAANDPMAVFAVAERYPNASAAADAVRLAAEMLGGGGASAARRPLPMASLRKLASSITDPAARTALNEAMLHASIAAGNLEGALGRARLLSWADVNHPVSASPGAIRFTASTAGALVTELQQAVFDRAEAALPDLKANLDGNSFDTANVLVVNEIATLLTSASPATGRTDRIVTISQRRELKIFEPGASEPLRTISVEGLNELMVVTWLPNDRLLLRQPSRVTCIDVNAGTVAWVMKPSAQPEGDINAQLANATIDDTDLIALAPRPSVASPTMPLTPEQQLIEARLQQGNMDPAVAQRWIIAQRMQRQNQVLQNRNRIINAQQLNGDEGDFDPPSDEGDSEAVVDALPVSGGTRVAVATSRGRLMILDTQTGETKWRLNLGDRAAGGLRVSGDLVVYATTDLSSSRVIAIDATTGEEVLRRTYPSGTGRVHNFAVSEEGWLAIVLASEIQLFDLSSGGREPLATALVKPESGVPPFGMSRAPNHVQFCGDKLLALADLAPEGMPSSPSVRSFDLPQLTPTPVATVKGRPPVERRFLPRFAQDRRTGKENIELAVHKDRLYVMTGQFMTSYPALDEDPADAAWTRVLPDRPSALSLQSPLLVREGVLLIGWPSEFIGNAAPTARAELYSRQLYDGKHESGMCVEDAELTRRGGKITDKFQAVNGGLYYTTIDNTLVFLPGKGK